jgi:hypothetical protein
MHQTYYPILPGTEQLGLDGSKIHFVLIMMSLVLSLMPMEPRLAPFTSAPLGANF